MKRRRHTPEQIIRKLRESERMPGEGRHIPEVTEELGISEATLHRWRNQYGGMKADEVKRLKELERENREWKVIVDRIRQTQDRRVPLALRPSPAFRVRNALRQHIALAPLIVSTRHHKQAAAAGHREPSRSAGGGVRSRCEPGRGANPGQ
jgi:transposase-like protein